MATVNLGGYDPNTGWPPDDSTGVNWDPDTDIPGQFGRGGFRTAPRLTAPASGPPPGISLSDGSADGGTFNPRTSSAFRGPRWGGGPPPDFNMNDVPPTNTPLRPGASPAIRPGGYGPATDAVPAGGGGGLFSRLAGFLPSIFSPTAAGVAAPAAIAAAGYKYGEPGRAKLTVDPRIDASGSGGFDVGQPLGSQNGPDASSPGAGAPPAYRPEDSPSYTDPRTFPGWPTPPAPAAAPAPGGMPWAGNNYGRPAGAPIGSPAPAVPPPRPRVAHAAGPAAQRQQPNLGAYSGPFSPSYRPNADVAGGARGRQSVPQMTTLDLSKLFSRQQ